MLQQQYKSTTMNTMYRAAFDSEAQAIAFVKTLIGGGIIQQQAELWLVWQLS